MTIKTIQIYGERCSGTNYLEHLIRKNYLNVDLCWDYGWKHFFPRVDLSQSDQCLFLVLFRNPYDWVRSLHRSPWHAHPSIRNLPLIDFLKVQWHCVWDDHWQPFPKNIIYGSEMMFERDPDTGKRFDNVLKMRNAKNTHWQNLRNLVQHVEFIRYEDLADFPKQTIRELGRKYSIKSTLLFRNEKAYKGEKTIRYKKRNYPALGHHDVQFMISQLDEKQENSIGYDLMSFPEIAGESVA